MWFAALVILVPLLAVLASQMLKQRTYYTSTDSVEVRSLVVGASTHQRVCVPNVEVGGGTAAVQWATGTPNGDQPALRVTISQHGRTLAAGTLPEQSAGGLVYPVVPIHPALPTAPAFRRATVCVHIGAGSPTQFAGMVGLATDGVSPTLDGAPINSRVSLWFLPRAGATRSLVDAWPMLMDRVSLFRPGFASPLFYWLLFVGGLPLLAYFALRTLAVAHEPRRKVVLALALIAFAGNAAWALTTSAFDTPDEPEHFAYTQTLAENGRAPLQGAGALAPYASDEAAALGAIDHFATIEFNGRPPWSQSAVTQYKHVLATQHPSRGDGGGYSSATAPHSPLYYSLLVPGYELGRSGGTFTELFWMRLTSALLGIVAPLCAFGLIRELAPSRRRLAVAAGLLVAFLPMYSFISGAVNNDVGVDAAAAALVYLTVRALRRGLTWRLAALIGTTAAIAPLMKGTAYALYPALLVALVTIAVRIRSRRPAIALVGGVAALIVTNQLWQAVASNFNRTAVPIPGGATGGATVATSQIGGKLTALWEVFFPRLPTMAEHWLPGAWPFFDIYVKRGVGGFGWYAIFFPTWVYSVVVAVIIAAGVGALLTTWRRWPAVRARWREALFLMLVISGVIAGVQFFYYSATPTAVYPEQGRYAFTAIVALAGLAVAGLFALPRRCALPLATILVSAMIVLSVASRILYLSNTYT